MTATDKSRGMLFSAPMVLALLNTKPGVWPAEPIDPSKPFKSQTRRIIKNVPHRDHFGRDIMDWGLSGIYEENGKWWLDVQTEVDDCSHDELACPHPVGSLIYVRESYYQFGHWEIVEGAKTKGGKTKWAFVPDHDAIVFEEPKSFRKGRHSKDPSTPAWHKRLGRFMPRAASRMLLKVMGVRAERCCDISPEDAIAEGIGRSNWCDRQPVRKWKDYLHPDSTVGGYEHPENSYRTLIESINGPEAWDKWVWKLSLKRLK